MESEIETISRGQWQWKSNQDPWSKSEEAQWESFLPKHNYLLEKAYYDQQKEVDLDDYIISLEDMKQTKKIAPTSQRPVRRINWMESIEEVGRSERYFESELPKTINKIFGGLGDFIQFFSKRNPEILSFTQKFEELENSHNLHGLNNEILPILVECLTSKLKPEESTNDTIRLFKKDFTSFKEFYGQILRAYTMSSCLYKNLNQYLRNESWTEIDGLLPYALCLFKTFSHFKKNGENPNLKANSPTMTLYRGTAFDEAALNFYDLKKFPNFSWNSATSTSKSKRVAQNFMFGSADIPNKKYPVMFIIEVPIIEASEDLKWIEVSSYSAFPAEDEIVLAPGSAFELQEVNIDKNKIAKIFIKMKTETKSLAYKGFMMQGALQSQMLTDPIMRIMCLEGEELIDVLGHISGNKFIEKIEFYFCKFDQGSLQKMMKVIPTTEKVNELSFLSCSNQDEEKVSNPMSKGVENFNVRKLEICEKWNLSTIFATASAHSKYWMSLRELNINWRAISDRTVNDLCWQGLGLLSQLTHLSLDFNQCHRLTDKGVHNLCSTGLKYLTQLIYLQLDFTLCGIGYEGINTLCSQGLQHLTRLTSLSLKINIRQSQIGNITDKEIDSLCLNGLRYLTELTSLEIDFPRGSEITDQGISSLSSQGLRHLPQLVSLRIIFFNCQKITDEGIKNFFNYGVKYLNNLRLLDLDVSSSPLLTDEGIKTISCQGLEFLTHLKTLKIKLSYCPKVTNQGLNHLFNYGLVHLSQLELLSLYFYPFKGVNNLLQSLTFAELKFLSLDGGIYLDTLNQRHLHSFLPQPEIQVPSLFNCTRTLETQNENSFSFWDDDESDVHYNSQISKQSWSTSKKAKVDFKKLKKWRSWNKSNLPKLKSVSLDVHLSQLESKTNEDLHNLCSQELKRLTRLKSLSLDFSQCSEKTNKTFEILCSQGFQHLKRLTDLQFNFSQDPWDPDQRINILCTQNLQYLTHLKSLHLNFSNSLRITDEGIKNLCINGLQHLIELESLSIDFTMDSSLPRPAFTDEGVKNLCFYGLKYLTQLTSLDLNFTGCRQIKAEGLNNMLDHGIENLTQLRRLNLDFSLKFGTFSGAQYSINCLGFQRLNQLTSLSLKFSHRWFTDEKGMENLCSRGLQNLTQLVFLNLNFSEGIAFCDRDIEILCSKGLKYLTQLRNLELNFSSCQVITDQGVNHLCFETLKYLIKLEALELNIRQCPAITPFTKQNILRVLRFFGFTVSSY